MLDSDVTRRIPVPVPSSLLLSGAASGLDRGGIVEFLFDGSSFGNLDLPPAVGVMTKAVGSGFERTKDSDEGDDEKWLAKSCRKTIFRFLVGEQRHRVTKRKGESDFFRGPLRCKQKKMRPRCLQKMRLYCEIDASFLQLTRKRKSLVDKRY